MVVEAVPESITREQYVSLVSAVGFDVKDLKSLEFRQDGIYAEVYFRDEEGRMVIDQPAGDVVVNRVYVPVRQTVGACVVGS